MSPACVYTFLFFCLSRDSCFYSCQWRDFIWRDFFSFGATFVCLASFLIWRDFFLFRATFSYLARSCSFGATFFLATEGNRFPVSP